MPSFIQRLVSPKTCSGPNTVLLSFPLPAGSYIVTAKALLNGRPDPDLSPIYTAVLAVGQGGIDPPHGVAEDAQAGLTVTDFRDYQVNLLLGVNLATPSNAQFSINMLRSTVSVRNAVMVAHSVE